MNSEFVELAPCGVYCGACPSYRKSCKGCASGDKDQGRCSKWSCAIRNCCYNERRLDYCIQCNEFPCKIINKKLLSSHHGDPRYNYRFEIPFIFTKLTELGVEKYLDFQISRWKCDSCGGRILFYHYTCNICGKKR